MTEPVLIIKDPPPREERQAIDWAATMLRARDEAPDQWALIARDAPNASASYLRRNFGVETRTAAIDPRTGRIGELYVKWVTGQSFLSPKAERYLERRERVAAVLAKRKEVQSDD